MSYYWVSLLLALFASATHLEAQICRHGTDVCRLINQWHAEGSAAGYEGIIYDNRDRGHSHINTGQFRQLNKHYYSQKEKNAKRDWGAAGRLLPGIVVGNSSTSAPPEKGGSNVRGIYYTNRSGMNFLYSQYRREQLYVYPEHRDHDPGHNGMEGYGDLYPTNSPYVLISQGSSGSDQAFLKAALHTLAAFRPEVRKKLTEMHLLMPTLQQILRRTLSSVSSREDYLSGKAHPTVFLGSQLREKAMVEAAHNLTVDSLIPFAGISVLSEDFDSDRRDLFPIERTEKLADTPCSVARIARGPSYERRLLVSAADSVDPNGKQLTYHWRLLRGDPSRVSILPSFGGVVAELRIAHHPRLPVRPGSKLESNRVDIALFVDNGQHLSAPAFVTVYYLDNELRTYDSKQRLVEIYRSAGDPALQIHDWGAFLDVMTSNHGSLPVTLLQARLDPDAMQALSEINREYREKGKTLSNAGKELEQAKAGENKSRTKELARKLESAKVQHKKVLDQARPELNGLSVKGLGRRIFLEMRDDLHFYLTNQQQIDSFVLATSNRPGKARFLRRIDKLRELGILSVEGKLKASMTNYEVYHLRRAHLSLLTEILYPRVLRSRERKNYVDPNIEVAKEWRAVYSYDQDGQLVSTEVFEP